MAGPQNLEQLISLCKAPDRHERLKSVTKDKIADLLSSAPDTRDEEEHEGQDRHEARLDSMEALMSEQLTEMKRLNDSVGTVALKINEVVTELKQVKSDYEGLRGEFGDLKKENTEMKEQMTKQGEIISRQQAFLERIDQKERSQNLIIVGVPEDDDEPDGDKVEQIIAKVNDGIGGQATVVTVKKMKRIGTRDDDKVRPLLVTVGSEDERNEIVKKARECTSMRGVRLKKDCHPSVRAEWKRLFDVKKAEETKAENAGKVVTVNLRKRNVTIDDRVIDTWKQPF